MGHQFVPERFSISLSRGGCLNYLHRLGFVLKRPKKRLVRADARKRESFVGEYAALTEEARRFGAKMFFAGEAHFRADAWADAAAGEPAGLYSPDFNAGEAVWGWAREEATGNLCLGTRALVQDRANNFLSGLASRRDEVKRCCRTVLQSRAGRLPRNLRPDSQDLKMHIPPWL